MAALTPKMPAPLVCAAGDAPPPVVLYAPSGTTKVAEDTVPSAPAVSPDTPLLVTVPHSGRYYPEDLVDASRLPLRRLRTSEDAFVDQLARPVVDQGVTVMVATHARCYVDLNRSHDELEADLFYPPLDADTLDETLRVRAGLGCIPRVVGPDAPIYKAPLPAREATDRLVRAYYPYHRMLEAQIAARVGRFGRAVLVDVHSMPSMAIPNRGGRTWPDIVLGDCWGASCSRDITALIESCILQEGFSVRRNVPYAGGYACQHYGRPADGVHVLQIEINRALYMDENRLKPTQRFRDVQALLKHLIDSLSAHIGDQSLAAE